MMFNNEAPISVYACLHQPLGDVAELLNRHLAKPAPVFTQEECTQFIAVLPAFVARGKEAVESQSDKALRSIMRVVQEVVEGGSMDVQQQFFAAFGSPSSATSGPLGDLHHIYGACLLNKSLSFTVDTQCEVLQVMHLLCEATTTKEVVGSMWVSTLCHLLANSELDFRVHRQIATCIIGLIKGSKANKALFTDLDVFACALKESTDFFFCMQATEILYRLSRSTKHLLHKVSLPQKYILAIDKLPNNTTLLPKMIDMLEDFASTMTPRSIYVFSTTRVDAHTHFVCEGTKIYFGKQQIVIMLPNEGGENITIPYCMIRSIRLSKEHKIILRLLQSPPKLASFLNIDAERDSVFIQVTGATLQELKASPVHKWINEVFQARKREQAANKRRREEEEAVEEESAIQRTRTEHHPDALDAAPEYPAVDAHPEHVDATRVLIPEFNAADASVVLPVLPAQQHAQQQSRALHELSMSARNSPAPKKPNPPVVESAANTVAPMAKFSEMQQMMPTGDQSIDSMLHQLRSVVAGDAQKKQRGVQGIMSKCSMDIEMLLQEAHAANQKDTEEFARLVEGEIAGVRASQVAMTEKVNAAFGQLQHGLEELHSIKTVLENNLTCVEVDFKQSTALTSAKEEQAMKAIRAQVDGEMKRMQDTMASLIDASNPLKFVTSFLSRKMETQGTL